MKTGEAKAFAKKMLAHPSLKDAPKIVILGLNRDNPGFGDDAALMDRETGRLQVFDGLFQRGTCQIKDEKYGMACEEYCENGWTIEDSGPIECDDLFEDSVDEDMDGGTEESLVIVPEEASVMKPGAEIRVSYSAERETWNADSYRIDIIEAPYGLAFHTNRNMTGIRLDEDFFEYPLVCWNTGRKAINVDGQKIPAGGFLILPSDESKRRERRLLYTDSMKLTAWDSTAKIKENEKKLIALGCPEKDVRALAVYFWCNGNLYDAGDYSPAKHSHWMEKVRQEERSHPED